MLTHVDLLELSTDGTIPAEAYRVARELDAQRCTTAATELTLPPVSNPRSKAALIGHMARVMIDRAALAGGCSETDLLSVGFSRAEIERHREAAATVARDLTADRAVVRRQKKTRRKP